MRNKLLKGIVYGLAIILAVGTILPFFKTHYWWVRSWDFPRAQLLICDVIVIAFILLIRRPLSKAGKILIAILTIATVYQAILILKYTPLVAVQTKEAPTVNTQRKVRILTANVRMSNREYDQTIQAIREKAPDIVLIIEPDSLWASALAGIKEVYPYTIEEPLANTYGMCLYSRLPLHNPRVNYIIKKGVPSMHASVELPSGEQVDLYAVHPMPPVPGTDSDERDAELLVIGKTIKASGKSAIVIGDLNDVAWSHTTRQFQRISRMLDPRVGRGFYNTYNAFIPVFRFPLDHIFHTAHFQLMELKRLGNIGSDHFPMLIELAYIPEEAAQQNTPKPRKSDQEEQEKKIQDGKDGD